MNDEWYVIQGQGPVGPFAAGFIFSGIQSGNIKADTQVSRDGQTGWRPISSEPAFAGLFGQKPVAPAPVDPFAALPSVNPEDQLRAAVRTALADGVVTGDEKKHLESIQAQFGISNDVVMRIVSEENAFRSAAIPASPSFAQPGAAPVVPLTPAPASQTSPVNNVMASPDRVTKRKPGWVMPLVVAVIGLVVLGSAVYLIATNKPDKTEEECKKDIICKYAGRCTPSGSKCVPGSNSDCAQSTGCEHSGRCTLNEKLGECVVGSDADCRGAYECTNTYIGKCKANVDYNRCEKPN